jgi:hypothetical protein
MQAIPLPDPTEVQGLSDQVDWMTYSHQQLYDMVNNGVDLNGATDVAASWASLSETLTQMSSTLNTALAASTDGWQGTAADKARTSLSGLVNWTNNTGENAVVVSGCVSRQADALQTARTAMPTPPPQIGNAPIPATQNPATQNQAFATPPIASPGPVLIRSQAAESHAQAARVMQQYQSSSADIARTIPQFYAPSSPVTGPTPPVNAPIAPPAPPHTGPGPIGGFGGMAGGGGQTPTAGVATGGIGTPRPTLTPRTSAAPESGASAEGGSAEPTQMAARSSSTMSPGGGGMGGGGRRGEDQEHRRKYWQEDDGIFEMDTRNMPRVIGEERRD